MMLQTKALYNLLQINAAEDPSVEVDAWAIENLRDVPLSNLFDRLAKQQVKLDKSSFLQFAEQCETPEDLVDLLFPDEQDEDLQDRFYLVVFELWRRLVPEKQSLSIFCDELDHRLAQYEKGKLTSDEPIQDALANLLEVLEENGDVGEDPSEVFAAICDYCAHDLESFIYDYTTEILESKNAPYASELIEDFAPFMTEPLWFEVLKARLVAFTDEKEADQLISDLLEQELDLQLLAEVLTFLAAHGDPDLFIAALKRAIPLVKMEEEFSEILEITLDYYHRLDKEASEQAVQKLLSKRKTGPADASDLKKLAQLVTK